MFIHFELCQENGELTEDANISLPVGTTFVQAHEILENLSDQEILLDLLRDWEMTGDPL